MPNRNGRGPDNAGPMTGRGKGRCNGNAVPDGFKQQPATEGQTVENQTAGCRGPMGCGSGRRGGAGAGRQAGGRGRS